MPLQPLFRTMLLPAIAAAFLWSQPHAAADDTSLLKPALISTKELSGRKVIRYEHASLEQWGYATPQKDYFYVVCPTNQPSGKVALRVVLHSAGGSGESEMLPDLPPARAPFIFAYTDPDSYGLYLDCRGNQAVDWWWGGQAIQNARASFKTELCPTEKRLLAEVAWAIRTLPIDSNRVYLSGCSMGGSGSLGIGLHAGDIFAAISVDCPAGVDHAMYRLTNGKHPDPPPVFNFSSENDTWAKDQEQLLGYCQTNHYAMAFAWGPYGHTPVVSQFNEAVYEFPWLSIRLNEAYPVFTGASTDNVYPGYLKTTPDQTGQINGFFRWKNLTDTPGHFAIELRLVKTTELHKPLEIPATATTAVTFRRLQHFKVTPGKTCYWRMTSRGQPVQSGQVQADADGLVTIPKVKITDTPGQLQLANN